MMWSFINTMQLLSHSILFNMDFPENVLSYNKFQIELISSDSFIPVAEYVTEWLPMDLQKRKVLDED